MRALQWPRLTFDLDADVCVIGGGLAGLTAALEIARRGESVVLIEAQRLAWGASGHHCGIVKPGFAVDIRDIVDRVGIDSARQLWALSEQGAALARNLAAQEKVAVAPGLIEASCVDHGDDMIERLQMLRDDFGVEVEGWQQERVREALKTRRYFHGLYFPTAFSVDAGAYTRALIALAHRAGVRLFEETPAVAIDTVGIRKRVVTPHARLRANHIVLAGNVHLGGAMQRLADTLMPRWRYAAITAPLGERFAEAISFSGAVTEGPGFDCDFRVIEDGRLMWSGGATTWEKPAAGFARVARGAIARVFPQLRDVEIAETYSGVCGETIHGMPQIGELRKGVWVTSGFGRQGLNTTAMAAGLIADAITAGDDRWRLFSPFELVWAGGIAGRVIGQAVYASERIGHGFAAALARHRERARARAHARSLARSVRTAAANGPPKAPRP